jgi:hypothetical protein
MRRDAAPEILAMQNDGAFYFLSCRTAASAAWHTLAQHRGVAVNAWWNEQVAYQAAGHFGGSLLCPITRYPLMANALRDGIFV